METSNHHRARYLAIHIGAVLLTAAAGALSPNGPGLVAPFAAGLAPLVHAVGLVFAHGFDVDMRRVNTCLLSALCGAATAFVIGWYRVLEAAAATGAFSG